MIENIFRLEFKLLNKLVRGRSDIGGLYFSIGRYYFEVVTIRLIPAVFCLDKRG